jgi:rRNA maturation RNase YbeY
MPTQFFFSDTSFSLAKRTQLKKFITGLFIREGKAVQELNYIFCSDEYLLNINRQFLAHDYYTDIITFDLSEKSSSITGEIYISIDRVKDNATNLKQTLKHELHRVIFHGALHLCGYKDKSKKDSDLMRKKEDYYLNQYFNS